MRKRAILLTVVIIAAVLALRGTPASAHPSGDVFTVNVYARMEPYRDRMRLLYLVDLAEAPSYDEMTHIDADGNGDVSPAEASAYLNGKSAELAKGLTLTIDGTPHSLTAVAGRLDLPIGAYGTPTVRARFLYDVSGAGGLTGRHDIVLDDANYTNRLGWREILAGDVPGVAYDGPAQYRTDITHELTVFSVGLFAIAPSTTHAAFAVTLTAGVPAAPDATVGGLLPLGGASTAAVAPSAPGATPVVSGSVARAAARGGVGAGSQAAALVEKKQAGLPLFLASLALAFGFGALHALEPGHGKSLVAAYFIGTRGSIADALSLGAIVAVAHTAGVLLIGGVVLVGANLIVPDRLFPMLQVISGLIVVGLGTMLALDIRRGRALNLGWLPSHEHGHDHVDTHEEHHHDSGEAHTHEDARGGPRPLPRRRLWLLGLADGLVPTASTIVMLLAAISLGRLVLGLTLIAAFGAGFGAVVAAVALTFVIGGRTLGRFATSRQRWTPMIGTLQRVLPPIAVCIFIVSGLVLAVRGALELRTWL